MKQSLLLTTEQATFDFAASIASQVRAPCLIFLSGELGAGKTTFVRGFLRALGYHEHVKSPSYAIVEHYQIAEQTIYHIDLYRLQTPSELDYLGLRDYLAEKAICLIEWPEKAAGLLPAADIHITMAFAKEGRYFQIT